MAIPIRLLLIVFCFTPMLVQAGPCDALFRFDRNLNDAGPNSYTGQMIGPDGVAAIPQFVEGKFGQAIRLDGSSVMRAFIDLHPDVCPQVTLTAWVQIEGEGNNQTQFFISSGSYRGPGMYIAGTNLTQAGSGNGQYQADAIRKGANWTFVAASYDNLAGKYRLHWRTRSKEMAMGTTTPPEEAVWIGAFDDKLGHPAKGIVLDDVQIIGRVISHDEFLAMQNSPAAGASTAVEESTAITGSALTEDSGVQPGPVSPAAAACASHVNCPTGSYCAVDNSCHPDSHAPKASDGGGMTVAEWNQQQNERNSELIGDFDYESPTDLLADKGSNSEGMTVEEWNEQQNERNSERFGEFNRPSTIDPLADARAASSGGASSEGSAAQDSSVQTEDDGMTVGGFLGLLNFDKSPTGDVRACSSYAEVVRDTATKFRDEIVALAATNACGLMSLKLLESDAGKAMAPGASVHTTEFARNIVNEAYQKCVATATGHARLPDTMVNFWNASVANDNWATIGPRLLQFRKTHSGNLISPGDRKFITPAPAMNQNATFLVLKELEGKARVNTRICTVSMFNEYRLLHDFTINATNQSQADEEQYFGYDLTNIRGKYIIVKLNAAGRFLRNFKYTLSVD